MPFFTTNVPAWFVDNCVKTSSQLKEQHIRLVVRETKPDVKKDSGELLLPGTTLPPSPTECPQDGEVHDQDVEGHDQDTDNMPATQQEKVSTSAPWSTPHEQLNPSETAEPSDPYELDAALYQRLRDLVVPGDSEDDLSKSQHLTTYPHIPKLARDLLHAIMTRAQVLRIIIDGIIFVLAAFLPIKFLQKCLNYMEMPRPWFVDAAASLRCYERFQFFKQAFLNMLTLLNIQPIRERRFIHDGVVLRFDRQGGGGQQFLTSVVGYFARDIGADLIILNEEILRGLSNHGGVSQTTPNWARWFAEKIGLRSSKVRDAINKIEGDDDEFEWEAKLLSSLVNPAKIKDGWDDIALEPEVRSNILRTVEFNIEKPKAYGILKNAQIGGALLYGPPGTGKTHLARVLAKECNSTMIQVSSATIEGRYVGDTEKLIRALFNLGRMVSPSIIFIDEAESIFRMRTSSDWSYDISRVNQLLGESDNLLRAEKSRPFLILSTNYPTQLDHAVLRRIPGRIYLGPPSLEAREDLFRIYLRKERIDSSLLPNLASMTNNYSGSDLRTLCIHAATKSHSEHVSQGEGASRGKRVIRMVHFEKALRANTPTITRAAMREIERFASQFDLQSLDQIRGYLSAAEHYTNGHSKSNADAEVNPPGDATKLVQAISGDN
ncbi:AAA-domain-containing protein [Apiospora arundinis]|uniref:AAA-domain-containing protein n=1 Tax=Apiospora arundinis TaxID=335852 RepID=A0ABR2JJ06_9PEZI